MKRVSYPGFSAEEGCAAGQCGKGLQSCVSTAHACVPLAAFGAQFAFFQFSA